MFQRLTLAYLGNKEVNYGGKGEISLEVVSCVPWPAANSSAFSYQAPSEQSQDFSTETFLELPTNDVLFSSSKYESKVKRKAIFLLKWKSLSLSVLRILK